MAVEERNCVDLHGRLISPGCNFAPGPPHPYACMLCICSDDGLPEFCKTAFCVPSTYGVDCKRTRDLGIMTLRANCDCVCADDDQMHPEADEANNLIPLLNAITSIIVITVSLYIANRIRKSQARTQIEDQRPPTSIQVTNTPTVTPAPRPSPREMLGELFRIHGTHVLRQPHCLVYEGAVHYYADGPNYLDNVNESSDSESEGEIFGINSNQRLR